MRLGTSMNVLFDPKRVSVEEALERLCRAGFEVLDFDLCDWLFEGSPLVGEGWEKWVSQIAQTAKRLGITFSQ
ncbi:TPA: sugar phosphate isomerase/epimerase, partial [Candidatus Micrarchaeota archaeon]|nr:sugar phosphate isomerase/epimerase [Candidatus Micrarchaeota archaeon]